MPIPPPVPGNISHKFGEDRRTRRHNGVDYDVDKGTPVKAGAFGIVVRSTYHEPEERTLTFRWNDNVTKKKKFRGSYGNVVIIYHGQDLKNLKHTYTLYAHLKSRSVKKYDIVNQDDVIATSGRSGTKLGFYRMKGGYKLHFEVLQSYKKLDWVSSAPLDFHCVSEDKRTNPEDFLSRSSWGFAIEYKSKYTVNLDDGTTITSDGLIVEHRDSNGKVLKTAMRGEIPSSGWGGVALKALKFLAKNHDRKGLHGGPGSPLNAEDLISEEKVKDWHKKMDEGYKKRNR